MLFSRPLRSHDVPPSGGAQTRDFRDRLWTWLAPAVLVVGFALLTVLRLQDDSERSALPTRWIAVALLVFGGWTCSRPVSYGVSLLALSGWCWIESYQIENWSGLTTGQIVRFLVSAGLVWWSHHIRDLLQQAHRLARLDSLTGLPNRQALVEALEAELCRTRRSGRPFSLALFDCDGFKGINDRSGHVVGDDVLRRIGLALREHTRRYDCVGRLGGDEFLLVLSEVDRDEAVLVAERLRAALRHFVERQYPSLTFSLGVVTFHSADAAWEECLRRVDETMYAAKRSGRDQTRFEVVEATTSPAVSLPR